MELLIIVVLLVVVAETTYLTVTLGRKNARVHQAPIFVDTSVLIDGRIVSIAESGFMNRPLYIPRSVVGELQYLADNADSEKRTRARHGLDVITQLQSVASIKVEIFNDGVRAEEGVDNRLLSLAKKFNGAALCTIDYNLNKVAVVEGIEVLNVNELAKSLRMAYLPGERMLIELTQKGNDQHQAVGHLTDGTMVVVEHAFKHLGKTVEIEFIRSLQTAAGKMMFAKLVQRSIDTQKTTQQKVPNVISKPATAQAKSQEGSVKKSTPKTRQPSGRSRTQGDEPQTKTRTSRSQTDSNTARRTREFDPARKPRPARRRSPEDSMVELANQ